MTASLRRIGALILKEFVQLRRDHITFATMIMIPLMQLVLFGYAINTTPRDMPTAVLLRESSDVGRSILAALANTKYFKVTHQAREAAEFDRLLQSGAVLFALEIPANFERALRISPNDADINHNYGWFLCQTGRESASVQYFLQAIRNPLYATPWRSYSAAGVCALKKDQFKDAEAFFERALKVEPDEPASLAGLGQIRYRQGNIGEARKLVSRYNKLVNPSAESLWLALRIERKLGQRVAEQSYANQLRRRYPGSPEYQALQRGRFD